MLPFPTMKQKTPDLESFMNRLEDRLERLDHKIDNLALSRHKSMEWLAQMSEHVRSLDNFREEVRASLEPLFTKLENIDEIMRIMRHATSDVSRRIELIEKHQDQVVMRTAAISGP